MTPLDSGWLPDPRTQALGANHRIAVLASPRLFELWHIAERSVHAPLPRRVGVRRNLEPLRLGTLDLAPDPRPAQEEPLLRRETVDGSDRLAAGALRGECLLQRRLRHRQAAEGPDVLA